MKIRLGLCVLLSFCWAAAAPAEDRTTTGAARPEIVFGPIEDLPPDLAAFAARARDAWFDDPGDPFAADRAAGTEAALVARPGGRDILLLEWSSGGNCGTDITAYAPALGPDRIGWACGVDVWTEERPGSAWPDILFASGPLAAGRVVFDGREYGRGGPAPTVAPVDPALSLATTEGRAYLRGLTLTDDYGRLFAIPEVRRRLSDGFGDAFARFLSFFEETSPLMTYDGYLYGTGVVRHLHGIREAFIAVGLENGDVQGGLFENGLGEEGWTMTIVSDAADVAGLPRRFREWVQEHDGGWSYPSPKRRVMDWRVARTCLDELAPTVACDR
jgi:hypothetical protein